MSAFTERPETLTAPGSAAAVDPLAASPMPFLMLLDRAVVECRRWISIVYWPAAVALGLLQLVIGVLQFFNLQGMAGADAGPDAVFGSCAAVLGIFFLGLLSAVVYVMLWAACADVLRGETPRLGSLARFALHPLHVVIFVLSAVLIFIGFLFCFLPGLVLAALLIVLVPVLRVEESGTAAVNRSIQLVGFGPTGSLAMGQLGQGLLLLVLSSVLSYALAGVFQLPTAAVQQYLVMEQSIGGGSGDGLSWLWLLIQLPASFLTGLAQAMVYYYIGMAVSLFYFDLRNRREGGDLDRALDALETRDTVSWGGAAP